MTITDTLIARDMDATAPPGRLVAVTATTFAVGTASTLWGAHTRIEIAIVLGALIVVTALVYGVLLPKKLERPNARVAMIVSAIAGASVVPAFWSALPLLLGVAGAILGYTAWKADQRPRTAIGAMVIGVLSVLGYFVVYIDEIIRYGLT